MNEKLQIISDVQSKIEELEISIYDIKEMLLNDKPVDEIVINKSVLNTRELLQFVLLLRNNKTNEEKVKNTLNNLVHIICTETKIDEQELLANKKNRKREYVIARQIHMSILNLVFNFTLAQSGAVCGKKAHATVLHGIETINNLLDTSQEFRTRYGNIFSILYKDLIENVLEELAENMITKFNLKKIIQ